MNRKVNQSLVRSEKESLESRRWRDKCYGKSSLCRCVMYGNVLGYFWREDVEVGEEMLKMQGE